ncbi:uncharacterized protein LOC105206525 isoform X1 [Solenopsis invicta]|uniref:uncharacterized protein LOC105206525 isoform X1 n=1 Tax=Solenopsis invicta TaxID=13686 RepID=UPI00193D3F03|nr:uncharacterized protein LOC105206525 isoform X1 [Solenopsis invicta]
MNVITLIAALFLVELCCGTLLPPTGKNKKEKGKGNNKLYKGPVDQDVFQRNLVVKNPKQQDILHESGRYFQNTKYRRFKGDVLGYCTPWNGNGFEISNIFHGKFTMVSPVWLTFPFGNTSTYQLSTHSVQTKWIKEMKANNNVNHVVKLIPRVLFEHWSIDDIIRIHSSTQSQTQLTVSLLDAAKEAVTGPDSDKWKEAIKSELEAHQKNNTWVIEQKRSTQKLIDSKWVFKVLRDTKGEVCRHKARLCARGFKQQPGLDYNEIFSPVVRYDSLRVMLALVAARDLELAQFDVQTAFLYGELEEEIWMEILEGLEVMGKKGDLACKLVKFLYGLRQSPRCWNLKFCKILEKFNFKASDADHCIFRGTIDNVEVFLALFVDDGLLASQSKRVLDDVLNDLNSCFTITIGNAKIFAGLQIERDRNNGIVFLHQPTLNE